MGLFSNKLTSERVYELLAIKVYAMDVLGYPESSQICDDFKPSEKNFCTKDSCQFGMRVKYQGKWDLEFRFYYSQKYKELRASVWFHNLVLYGNRNDASDELRENIREEFSREMRYGDQYEIHYNEVDTVVYLTERKIKELEDVAKYVHYNFQETWNRHKIIDVLTQFKTSEELGLGCFEIIYEDESVEIDGISSLDDIYNY